RTATNCVFTTRSSAVAVHLGRPSTMKSARSQWGEPPWPRGADFVSDSGLTSSRNPDVAIIGAGLTGTSTALHLAKRGIRAVVYEAGLVADGASGRTGGLVLEGTSAGPRDEVDTCVTGLERVVAYDGIACDLVLPGCWEIEHHQAAPENMLPWTDAG